MNTTELEQHSKKYRARLLNEEGMPKAAIARTLGVDTRTVFRWLKETENTSGVKLYAELAPEVRACIDWSADGFERFFNRYSGRELQPVHKLWVQDAIEYDNLLVNVPPRHAKSTIFTVWFPIWLVSGAEAVRTGKTGPEFGLRDVQILVASSTEKQAKKFTNEISIHLATNELLINDFGPFKPPTESHWPWRPNQGELLVNGRRRNFLPGDLSIQIRGAGQAVLGAEAHWVIADDVATLRNQATEGERERVSAWLFGEVMSRLDINSRCIVIGQRVRQDDIYDTLMKEGTEDDRVWQHLNYPAVLNWDTEEVLWPERWNFDALMKARSRVTPKVFEVMYQQNPMPEERRIARKEWLYGDETHIGCVDEDAISGPRNQEAGWVRVLSIDPSPTRRAGLVVLDAYRPTWDATEFQVEILEMVHEPMTVHDMVEHIDRVWRMYRPQYFVFETVAAQRWFLQDKDMDFFKGVMRVIPHITQHNKADANLGVESLALDFELGRIQCPYGDADSRNMTEDFFEQARTYPEGRYDDLLMALWFVKWNFNRLQPLQEIVSSDDPYAYPVPGHIAQNGYGIPTRPDYGLPQPYSGNLARSMD